MPNREQLIIKLFRRKPVLSLKHIPGYQWVVVCLKILNSSHTIYLYSSV